MSDERMVQEVDASVVPPCCVACNDPVPDDARARGWKWATFVDGDPAWLCPDCQPRE